MNDFLDLYDVVLYRGFYPWLNELKLNYSKGARHRKACFASLVENEGKGFLNALYLEMESAYNDYERIYLAHEALNVLEQKLERTALLISEYTMEVELIGAFVPTGTDDHTTRKISSPTYCSSYVATDLQVGVRKHFLQLVKKELICLYIKVQERYREYLRRNIIDDKVVKENKAGNHKVGDHMVKMYLDEGFLVETPVVEVQEDVQVLGKKEVLVEEPVVEDAEVTYKQKSFKPVMGDTRPVLKGVFSYADIVAHKSKFAQLEVELFNYELLDTEYRFKKKPHGNMMKMAAVYWVAFQRGYFSKHYMKNGRNIPITVSDVRLFLNHRYDTNIERQFQNFSKKELLNDYIEKDVMFRLIIT